MFCCIGPQRKYHLTKLPDSLHYAGLSPCNAISKRWSLGQHTWWVFHGRDIDVTYPCGRRQMLRLSKVASLKLGQNSERFGGKYCARQIRHRNSSLVHICQNVTLGYQNVLRVGTIIIFPKCHTCLCAFPKTVNVVKSRLAVFLV